MAGAAILPVNMAASCPWLPDEVFTMLSLIITLVSKMFDTD